ncbi:MAG TPA: hypothetical protein PKC39_05555 [Ferruginibacter sp.]|nr:hypothetical protein [Ferruginibacter sp.]HMP20407.1 hypothetical protein [Ferruginibacter sp.]
MPKYQQRLDAALQKLVPNNIPNAACRYYQQHGIAYGISAWLPGIEEKNGSVCMGLAYGDNDAWYKPNTPLPDGTYAIFRSDNNYTEAASDAAGSRAIWYYFDEEVFIASTSQRAIINVVGKFEFDRRVLPWMLSSGTLGPSLSWCSNLQQLPPGATACLNRHNWSLKIKTSSIPYQPVQASEEEHRHRMQQAMVQAFKAIDIDLSKWILPISGGYDSRGILCLLHEAGKNISALNAITWGLKAALKDKATDAFVGTKVAETAGLKHQYFATDHTKASVEEVFERFVQCGEGRVDHIPAYLDGFALWKYIYETGCNGVLRGDESFGWHSSGSEISSRLMNCYTFCNDYSNLEDFEELSGEKQFIPTQLNRKKNETLSTWTDRLYEEFSIPVQMSALNDLKLAYTEVINPLLSRQIIACTHSLPDELRLDKKLFKEMVNGFLPKVDFAKKQATAKEENLFKTAEAVNIMRNEIAEPYMRQLFPEVLINRVLDGLSSTVPARKNDLKESVKNGIKNMLPDSIKEKIRSKMPKPALDNGILAFRMYLAGKTHQMLCHDIKELSDAKYLEPA